jgi:hypothetical protein
MDGRLLYGFWTWSKWWAGRRFTWGPMHTPPSPAHRLHQRPIDRRTSTGGNPSLLALRRLPCVFLGSRRPRGRRVRAVAPVT